MVAENVAADSACDVFKSDQAVRAGDLVKTRGNGGRREGKEAIDYYLDEVSNVADYLLPPTTWEF